MPRAAARTGYSPGAETALAVCRERRQVVHIADITTEPAYVDAIRSLVAL